jgi:tRNA-2-methylthio-N6-dimethylallyladenosine synthase
MSLTRVQSKASTGLAGAAPSLHVVTFGCQMNKYDSERVEGRFRREGWRTTERMEEADLVLFNTCSVREHAEERVWSWLGELRRAKERRPGLVIGVIGCMAQRVEDELFERAGHVDLVVGTRAFHRLPELVEDVRARRAAAETEPRRLALAMEESPDAPRDGEPYAGGVHGYLTVMRGCDLNCAFCIVPTVRGRVLSRPVADVVAEARWMVAQGARAITLLGQTVNSYGEDLPEPGPGEPRGQGRGGRPALADLLDALEEVEDLARVRLITLHPSYVTPALADAIARSTKCERFLPLPAQSGSDRVLRAMRRGYTVDLYRRRVDLLRERVPDLELGSDWIVGFPGETEQDFAASEALLEEQGFAVNYVFKYSPRPGTRAAAVEDSVPEATKKERNARLLAAGERAALRRTRALLGREVEVLVESRSERDPALVKGRTRHGFACTVRATAGPGQLLRARVEQATAYGLSATSES